MSSFDIITSDNKKFVASKEVIYFSRVLYDYFINTEVEPKPKPTQIKLDLTYDQFNSIYQLLLIAQSGEAIPIIINRIKKYLEQYNLINYIKLLQNIDKYQFNSLIRYILPIIIEFLRSKEYLDLWRNRNNDMIMAIESLDLNNPELSKIIAINLSNGKYVLINSALNDPEVINYLYNTIGIYTPLKVINTLDELIKDLPKSNKQTQDYKKIIPLLEKIIQEENRDICSVIQILNERFSITSPICPPKFKTSIPTGLSEKIRNCEKSLAIIPISILPCGKEGVTYGHANLIIINKNTKEYERFEPLGYNARGEFQFVDDFMLNEFKTILGPEYKYIYPADFCFRYISEDKYEEEIAGLCVVQTTIYAHLRIINPELTREDIINYLASLSLEERTDLIRKYITYMDRLVAKEYIELIGGKEDISDDEFIVVLIDGSIKLNQSQVKQIPYIANLFAKSLDNKIVLDNITRKELEIIISLLPIGSLFFFTLTPESMSDYMGEKTLEYIENVIHDLNIVDLINLIINIHNMITTYQYISSDRTRIIYGHLIRLLSKYLMDPAYIKLWKLQNSDFYNGIELLDHNYPDIVKRILEDLTVKFLLIFEKKMIGIRVSGVEFSSDGTKILIKTHDIIDKIYKYRSIDVYDIKGGNIILSYTNKPEPNTIVVSPDNGKIFIGSTMYNLKNGNIIFSFFNKNAENAVFSNDSNQVAIFSGHRWKANNLVEIYNTSSGKLLHTFNQYERINSLYFTKDGTRIILVVNNTYVKIHNNNSFKETPLFESIELVENIWKNLDTIASFSLTHDEKKIAIYTINGLFIIYDLNTGKELFNIGSELFDEATDLYDDDLFNSHSEGLFSLDDSKFFFTFSTSSIDNKIKTKTLKVFNAITWEILFTLSDKNSTEYIISPDGNFIYSISKKSPTLLNSNDNLNSRSATTTYIYEPDENKYEEGNTNHNSSIVSLSPDGKIIAFEFEMYPGIIELDEPGIEPEYIYHVNDAKYIEFSPDSTKFIILNRIDNPTIRIYAENREIMGLTLKEQLDKISKR